MNASRLVFHVAILATAILASPFIVVAQQREPGGAASVVTSASATVKLVDPATRIILLETAEGGMSAIRCGRSVTNFDQIKVGDQVRALALERIAVFVGKGLPGTEDAGIIIHAPRGARPGILLADSDQISARIAAIDTTNRTVTLEGPEARPIKVAPDVDLAAVARGDQVNLRTTRGLALWVQSPQDAARPAAAVIAAQGTAGIPGFEAMDTASASATVESIDKERRIVTLRGERGLIRQVSLSASVVNFDQIAVGDKVRTILAEEVAVAISKGVVAPTATFGAVVARAPQGAKPGIVIADTVQYNARIQSIDSVNRTITIVEPDSRPRTIKVGSNVNLSELSAGDNINARVTQALAILVEKP